MSLTARLPAVDTAYDRTYFTGDFFAAVSPTNRNARDYGAAKTSASAVGEGCGDKSLLATSPHAKTRSMAMTGEKCHLVAPMIAGRAGK